MKQTLRIIEGCIAGKRRFQRKFYDLYAVPMYRVCYRYLKSEFDTEDALSTGFTKIFENLHRHTFKSEKHLFNWIKKVMINESLMLLRSQIRFQTIDMDVEIAGFQNADALQQMDAEEVYALIQALPKGYRTIFNLFVIDGYSHAEIAEELDITESTSRSQLTKARKILQSQLKTLQVR